MNQFALIPVVKTPMPQNIEVNLTPIPNCLEMPAHSAAIKDAAIRTLRSFGLKHFIPGLEEEKVQLLTHNFFNNSALATTNAKLSGTSLDKYQKSNEQTAFIFANSVLDCSRGEGPL